MTEKFTEIKKRKSYPAVLINVLSEYDPIKSVYVIKFVYEVYINVTQTVEVCDNFYMWNYSDYYNSSIERLRNTMSLYNLNLISKDLRSEDSIVNCCKWLTNTVVEIQKYLYKGTRFKVVSTERNDFLRVRCLWNCMINNNLDNFEQSLKEEEDLFKDFRMDLLEDLNPKEEGVLSSFLEEFSEKKPKRRKPRKRK